jgi:hypothetical protein
MRDFKLWQFGVINSCPKGYLAYDGGPPAAFGRNHLRISYSSVRRTIQRLDSENSVCSRTVFLPSPQ